MITELTLEQQAQLAPWAEKWIAIGLSTERMDRELVADAVKKMYTEAYLEPPEIIHFCDNYKEADEFIKKRSGGAYNALSSVFYGSMEADWIAFATYFRDVVKLDGMDIVNTSEVLVRNAGWINFFDDCAVVTERPTKIKLDENQELHCEDGPALSYMGGVDLYFWHGVEVPGHWIKSKFKGFDKDLAQEVLATTNLEVRRAGCEIIGWDDIITILGAKTIDEDPDPTVGTLLEVEIPDVGVERYLRVLCGTGRQFALPVPPSMKTAIQANAWTYDVDIDVIRNLQFRT